MRRLSTAAIVLIVFFLNLIATADDSEEIEFRADYYERDLGKNTLNARGNAWAKKGKKQVWADELQIEFGKEIAIAHGNVHIKDGDMDIWCDHATYALDGTTAILEEATLIKDKMVITGKMIHKKSSTHYIIEEGGYTNCNVELLNSAEAGNCTYDWKVSGKHIDITLEGYAHIQDALVYAKGLPFIYSPYFIFPVKSRRQTGLLMPSLDHKEALGTGLNLPFFWALGKWHDVTLDPTIYFEGSKNHLGLEYRYAYASDKSGVANLFLLQRSFSSDRANPAQEETNSNKFLGLVGEWALDIKNVYYISKKIHTHQLIRFVSDPFITIDYDDKINAEGRPASLRSQFSLTIPGDQTLFTAEIRHHQNLIISEDSGVDRGAVTKFPSLSYSLTSTHFLNQLFSFEFDSNFINFYRPSVGFDDVPPNPQKAEISQPDPDKTFDENDYIRTGRRLQLEPRIVANFPLATGFQFQPVLKTGALIYHFDIPRSEVVHREYADLELPFSMYLSKHFKTGIKGYEELIHIFQPRVIYGVSLYRGGDNDRDHPFFLRDSDPLEQTSSNPRFDIVDQLTEFNFMRVELINRVLRRKGTSTERFLLLQISEQANFRPVKTDPRFARSIGPIEFLGELTLWRFSAQFQGKYEIETAENTDVRENSWSGQVSYRADNGDAISVGARFQTRADAELTQQTTYINANKILSDFLQATVNAEYGLRGEGLLGYSIGLDLAARPRSCWQFGISFGENNRKQSFFQFRFIFDFGEPTRDLQ